MNLDSHRQKMLAEERLIEQAKKQSFETALFESANLKAVKVKKLPSKLKNIGDKFADTYDDIYRYLEKIGGADMWLNIALSEARLLGLGRSKYWLLMIQMVEDGLVTTDHDLIECKENIELDDWWGFSESKAVALQDHLAADLLNNIKRIIKENTFIRKYAGTWHDIESELPSAIQYALALHEMVATDEMIRLGETKNAFNSLYQVTKILAVIDDEWGTLNSRLNQQYEGRKKKREQLESDPIQLSKNQIKSFWDDWQKNPQAKYHGKASEFAIAMRKKFPNITGDRTITEWCTKWKKSLKINKK